MVVALVKIGLLIFGLMTGAAYLVLLERWIAAWVQDRKGPNRVGIPLSRIRLFGLGQPLADGLKFIFKEEYTPRHVDRLLFTLAPLSILVAALAAFAVIPFGSVLPASATPEGMRGPIELVVAPGVDVGLLYVFALSSVAVYGVILGGWASNNKYSFLGALRSSAQLVAYELPLGAALVAVVLATGSLRLDQIIAQQAASGVWNVLVQPLGFVVFVTASFAESARLPFDLPECEQELVGGYHTEYSGVRLLMFLVAEFLHMVMAAVLIVVLYLGGWHFWGLTGSTNEVGWGTALVRVLVLGGKTLMVIVFLFMLARWSWPRFRFDQLMALAWKVMLPLGLTNLVAVAAVVEWGGIRAGKPSLAAVLVLWGIGATGWLAAGWAAPSAADNRPRLEPS
ncbi:MAG: NADH-quinone oxidoreductase subunit H [Pirellulales bacterium]|nr:NADH-quinone oxidoreductase subunit H [Pirellulales bacterium]